MPKIAQKRPFWGADHEFGVYLTIATLWVRRRIISEELEKIRKFFNICDLSKTHELTHLRYK